MKRLILYALLAAPIHAGLACQYTANAKELEGALEDRQEMKELAARIAEQADRIFVGTVEVLSETSATFNDIVNLKGNTPEGTQLEWTLPEEVGIGCSDVYTFTTLQKPEKSNMAAYLVYAKGNRLLRANEVGSFAEKPSGYEELEWLEEGRHITNHSSRRAKTHAAQ